VEAVDLSYADQRGIMVTNTPGANSGAVAEHAVALILSALRHVTAGDRRVRRGDWQVQRTRELGSLMVGIVGVGRIGRGVADRLSGFGSTVLGYDPWVDEETLRAAGIAPTSLTEMATRSDVVSLHAPGDARLVDRDWLSMVKPSLILVNTARAMLVDEVAVAEALAADRLQLYATDTLSAESGTDSRLLDPQLTDRTIFTPHSAAHTVEAVDKMSGGAVAAVLAMLSGATPADVVRPGASKEIG
jgi:D-3-phosphoglycerate dehydrogenase / 2-oxoglutarate reductase